MGAQLSRPRATNDPQGVLFVVHRCTAPIGPDSGRVVRMAARGGAPPSLPELYTVLTKALGSKDQPPVVAVLTALGKPITSPAQLTSGQHLLYACAGDRRPRVVKKMKRSTKVAKATATALLASTGASVLVRSPPCSRWCRDGTCEWSLTLMRLLVLST
jgi:hypothetical protein